VTHVETVLSRTSPFQILDELLDGTDAFIAIPEDQELLIAIHCSEQSCELKLEAFWRVSTLWKN